MITKHHRGGKSVRRLLDYCLRQDQDPEIVGGTMSGQNARELSSEFSASRALCIGPSATNRRILMPV
jgi:hypothetical protein